MVFEKRGREIAADGFDWRFRWFAAELFGDPAQILRLRFASPQTIAHESFKLAGGFLREPFHIGDGNDAVVVCGKCLVV